MRFNFLEKKRPQAGFTLLEIMVVVVILSIIGAIIVTSFTSLNRRQAMDKDVLLITTILKEARSLTLSSVEASRYGVHLENDEITLFKGSSYSSSDPDNVDYPLSTYTQITTYSLSGGGDNIIFNRLTGATSQSGTITLTLKSDNTITKVITVEGTGIVNTN